MKKFYDRYWEKEDHCDFGYKWPAVRKFIPTRRNIKILDYGCGKGIFIPEILKLNRAAEIVGADVSKSILNAARKKFKGQKFFLVEDGKKLPFEDKQFDFILCLDVIEHVYDTELLFSELDRVLKDGGRILISTPYHGLFKNLIISLFFFELIFDPYSSHIRFFTKKSLLRCLSAINLEPIKMGYYGRIFPLSRAMYVFAQKDKK